LKQMVRAKIRRNRPSYLRAVRPQPLIKREELTVLRNVKFFTFFLDNKDKI
jgi:hypothetical protein